MPVTIFNIPGIVPLVPGGLAYQAVRNIVIGNYEKGAYFTVQAVMIAGAIALGLVASEVFNQNIRSFREKENLWVLFVVNATKLKIDKKVGCFHLIRKQPTFKRIDILIFGA